MVRLRQCECALADGLLDEAFEVVRRPEVRGHRRGQVLAGRVVAALVERGRGHLAAGRLVQALADGEKAGVIGGDRAEVAELRTAAATAMREQAEAQRAAGQAVAAARRAVEAGNLTVGERILERAGAAAADLRGFALRQEVAFRRAATDDAVGKAKLAVGREDIEAAVGLLAPLGRDGAGDAGVREVCGDIEARLAAAARATFESGRLDEARRVIAAGERLPVSGMKLDGVRTAIEQCAAAWRAIESGRAGEAVEILRRVAGVWTEARWLADAVADVEKVAAGLSAVRCGPLAMTGDGTRRMEEKRSRGPFLISGEEKRSPGPFLIQGERGAEGQSRGDLFLHVDGVGSFLVCGGEVVTLGPVGASRRVDVPLMVDAGAAVVSVVRSEEDYFVRVAGGTVVVNGEEAANRLLRSGDRIGIGGRCRVTFRRPSGASGSAVLDLAGTRLPGSPVRQVILMDREIVIGPGGAAHVRADGLAAPVVLQPRGGGRWVCRSVAEVSVEDRAVGTVAEFALGERVAVGSAVRFVVVGEERRV